MGQTVSDTRKAAGWHSAESKKLAGDVINMMQDLAKQQLQSFREQVSNNIDSAVPVSRVLSGDSLVRCNVSYQNNEGSSIKSITQDYMAFADGEFGNFIGKYLTVVLSTLLENSKGTSDQMDKFFVTAGNMDQLFQLDLRCYSYRMTSESLRSIIKNVVVVSVVVSTIDVDALDESTIHAVVQACYGGADRETRDRMLERLIAVKQRSSTWTRAGIVTGSL